MDDMTFKKGQRIAYTGPDGVVHNGRVDVQRQGWVMIDLDEPCDTNQGWHASKMMVKVATLSAR